MNTKIKLRPAQSIKAKSTTTVVTHSGKFHADDLFGVASLLLAFPDKKIKVVRSIDKDVIEKGDYVLDIGRIHDPKANRFDHHQEGGAGLHTSGVPYAAFGLVWKKFGPKIAGSKELAEYVEKRLVAPFDAEDNGVNLYDIKYEGVYPVHLIDYIELESIEQLNMPDDKKDMDKTFMRLLPFAQRVIALEVGKGKKHFKAKKMIERIYKTMKDKRIFICPTFMPFDFEEYPEVMFYVFKDLRGNWSAKAVRKNPQTTESRMYFPEKWRGKVDAELAAVSHVPDAVFCHNSGFLAVARSKEGVVDLVAHTLL